VVITDFLQIAGYALDWRVQGSSVGFYRLFVESSTCFCSLRLVPTGDISRHLIVEVDSGAALQVWLQA
jgi:hypothetical protein